MDKDLQDAVLAAFDGEPEDKAAAPDQAKDDVAAGAAEEASTVVLKPGSVQKKAGLSAAGTAHRMPTSAAPAVRKAAPAREASEEPAAVVAPRSRAAAAYAPAASAPRATAGGMLSILLGVALVVLLVILLIQTISLRATVNQQEAILRDLKSQDTLLREVKNLARVTVSVYQEPGKRPQKVIAVHDLGEDGKLELKKLTILPLEEQ